MKNCLTTRQNFPALPLLQGEGIEVKGAWLDNGLLHIDLVRPQPEVRVKTIQINRATGGNGNGQAGKVRMVDSEPRQE